MKTNKRLPPWCAIGSILVLIALLSSSLASGQNNASRLMRSQPSGNLPLEEFSSEHAKIGFIDYPDDVFPNDAILAHPNIEYVYLRGGVIGGENNATLKSLRIDTSKLSRLTNLKYIEIVGYQLDSTAREIIYSQNLKGVTLVNCGIDDGVLDHSRVSQLSHLDLAFNQISDITHFESSTFPKLGYLNLARNQISHLSGLGELNQLTTLDLSNRYNMHDNWVLFNGEVVPLSGSYNRYNLSLHAQDIAKLASSEHLEVVQLEVPEHCEVYHLHKSIREVSRRRQRAMLRALCIYTFDANPIGVQEVSRTYVRLRKGLIRKVLYSKWDKECE